MRVLIASDLSASSDHAVQQGALMAAGGPVALCHVMPELQTYALLAQEYETDLDEHLALQPRISDALRDQWVRLAPDTEPVPEVFIEQGSAYEQILRRAEQWQPDLIAMGTHGRVGLKRLLLGSVAVQVVRAANCPVLVARAARPGAVLAATNLDDPALPVIEAAATEAARRGLKLVVMHAMQAPNESAGAFGLVGALPVLETSDTRGARRALASEIINSALTRLHARGEIVITDEDALQEILRLAEALPAELLVVGTHGRKGLSRIVLGSTTAAMIEHAPCSVLVTRQANSTQPAHAASDEGA